MNNKIALITDEHFGLNGNSDLFLDYQERFFKEIFFPYLEKNKIKTIISLGDEFDSRKNINYNTLSRSKNMFFDRVENEGYEMYIILGNHNLYFKNISEVNSPELLFKSYKNFKIISNPTEVFFGNCKFLMLPWINKSNEDECFQAIQKTDAEYLLGHFEVSGMNLHKNWKFTSGIDINVMKKFKEVWSGHYHLKLQKNNFLYLGTAYQMSWEDFVKEKGFYSFDIKKRKLSYHKNPYQIYRKIIFDDIKEIEKFNFEEYKDTFVIVILNKSPKSFSDFDLFCKSLNKFVHDLKVEENYIEVFDEKEINIEVVNENNTFQLSETYINELSDDMVNKKKLKDMFSVIYGKARNIKNSIG